MSVINPISDKIQNTQENETIKDNTQNKDKAETVSTAAMDAAYELLASVAEPYYAVNPMGYSENQTATHYRAKPKPYNSVPKKKPTSTLPKVVNSNTDLSKFVTAKILPPAPLVYLTGGGIAHASSCGGRKVKTEAEVISYIKKYWAGYCDNIFKQGMIKEQFSARSFYPSVKREFEAGDAAKAKFRALNKQYEPKHRLLIRRPVRPPIRSAYDTSHLYAAKNAATPTVKLSPEACKAIEDAWDKFNRDTDFIPVLFTANATAACPNSNSAIADSAIVSSTAANAVQENASNATPVTAAATATATTSAATATTALTLSTHNNIKNN